MIGYLRGRVIEHINDNRVLLLVGDVGYEVVAPLSHYPVLDPTTGMYVYTHTTDRGTTLYGFAELRERLLVEEIAAKTQGVGPAIASRIVHEIGYAQLEAAVVADNVKPLHSGVRGVGAPVARRVVDAVKPWIMQHATGPNAGNDVVSEAAAAIQGLGRAVDLQLLRSLAAENGIEDYSQLVTLYLRNG